MRSLSKPAIQRSSEEQLLWKFWEKNASGRLLFSKAASSLSRACNFMLNKAFTILILSFSLISLTGFTFCFISSVANGRCNDNKTNCIYPFIVLQWRKSVNSLMYYRRLQLYWRIYKVWNNCIKWHQKEFRAE